MVDDAGGDAAIHQGSGHPVGGGSLEKGPEVADQSIEEALAGLEGEPGGVRCDEEVTVPEVGSEERMIGGGWLDR